MIDKLEKKAKEIINYLAFQAQVQKQMLVKLDTNNKLLQELVNQSKLKQEVKHGNRWWKIFRHSSN